MIEKTRPWSSIFYETTLGMAATIGTMAAFASIPLPENRHEPPFRGISLRSFLASPLRWGKLAKAATRSALSTFPLYVANFPLRTAGLGALVGAIEGGLICFGLRESSQQGWDRIGVGFLFGAFFGGVGGLALSRHFCKTIIAKTAVPKRGITIGREVASALREKTGLPWDQATWGVILNDAERATRGVIPRGVPWRHSLTTPDINFRPPDHLRFSRLMPPRGSKVHPKIEITSWRSDQGDRFAKLPLARTTVEGVTPLPEYMVLTGPRGQRPQNLFAYFEENDLIPGGISAKALKRELVVEAKGYVVETPAGREVIRLGDRRLQYSSSFGDYEVDNGTFIQTNGGTHWGNLKKGDVPVEAAYHSHPSVSHLGTMNGNDIHAHLSQMFEAEQIFSSIVLTHRRDLRDFGGYTVEVFFPTSKLNDLMDELRKIHRSYPDEIWSVLAGRARLVSCDFKEFYQVRRLDLLFSSEKREQLLYLATFEH